MVGAAAQRAMGRDNHREGPRAVAVAAAAVTAVTALHNPGASSFAPAVRPVSATKHGVMRG